MTDGEAIDDLRSQIGRMRIALKFIEDHAEQIGPARVKRLNEMTDPVMKLVKDWILTTTNTPCLPSFEMIKKMNSENLVFDEELTKRTASLVNHTINEIEKSVPHAFDDYGKGLE